MNSRVRYYKTIHHQTPDRPPLDGWFHWQVWDQLKNHFSLSDDESLRKILGLDFRNVVMEPAAPFREHSAHLDKIAVNFSVDDWMVKQIEGRTYEDEWGVRLELDEKEMNWHYCYHPLQDEFSMKKLRVPDLRRPGRFETLKRDVERWKDKYIVVAGVSTLFRKGWLLCGFSNFQEALLLERESIEKLLDILLEYTTELVNLYIDHGVDEIRLLGDLGGESSMFISPQLWRELFKPRMKALIQNTRRNSVKFFLHSDGSIKEIIPDLIEIGLDILNPIQPECLFPSQIKAKFGDRLTLHGTMSLQKTFPFGTEQDVCREVDDRLVNCGRNGGLILAGSNLFTPDIPLRNIVAFYQYCQELQCHPGQLDPTNSMPVR